MSIARIRILAIAVALAGSGVTISLLQARTSDWKVGDVFVAIGKGKYEVRSSTGALKETIDTGTNKEVAGCWFDSQFNLYTADIYNTKVLKHDFASPSHTQSVFANTLLQAPDGHSKSIVMAVNGDVYVGNAGNPNGTGTRNMLRYRSDGAFLGSFSPGLENGGIDWMDLATDQRTMFYTSRGRLIKRFKVGTGQGADITISESPAQSTGQAFAIRLLPPFKFDATAGPGGPGGLLVADNVNIKQVTNTGTVIATWDVDVQGNNNDENAWQALNLDPDGLHFWALGTATGRLFRFSLSAPGVNTQDLPAIQTGGSGSAGLCIMGEPQTQVYSLNLSTPPGPSQFFDVSAKFGDPTAIGENDFYSFSTYRIRVHVKGNQSVIGAIGFTPQSTSLVCNPDPNNPNQPDPNDFDCRFTQTPAQCVPFFKDPSAANPLGSLDPYRCAFYRLEMPNCSIASPGTCPYDEAFVAGTDDIDMEYIMNMTNPPSGVFNVSGYGPAPKGNPRVMRDPSRVAGNQFFVDATAAVIDWPAIGTGGFNDYSPAQRMLTTPGVCAEIIKPDNFEQNSGSSIKVQVVVKTGPLVGTTCTGTGITGAASGTNKITLAIAGTGPNTALKIYCAHQGNANDCFTEIGSAGTYQANVVLNPAEIPPDNVNPYIFAVTSVNVADPAGPNNPGIFPPVARQYKICTSGSCQ